MPGVSEIEQEQIKKIVKRIAKLLKLDIPDASIDDCSTREIVFNCVDGGTLCWRFKDGILNFYEDYEYAEPWNINGPLLKLMILKINNFQDHEYEYDSDSVYIGFHLDQDVEIFIKNDLNGSLDVWELFLDKLEAKN